jgi:hypothetical protein
MSSEAQASTNPEEPAAAGPDSVLMPGPTAAPLVLALGMTLLAAGAMTGALFLIAGAVVLAAGLASWIADLLPGRGHVHEPLVEPSLRARPVSAAAGSVEHLRTGLPGYRLRLPVEVHPISAGLKGGIVGGLVMPLPALAYGLLSRHGPWYPVNLLAGMVLPGVETMSVAELERFQLSLFIVASVIHAVNSVVFGLIYGVLLPTLPEIPKPLAWGGLLMPVLWSAVSFGLMRVVNPVLNQGVDWPLFMASQFLFGVITALVVMIMLAQGRHALLGGLVGGIVGGLLMPAPAVLWGLASGHGVWYPINLLAAMVIPHGSAVTPAALAGFHPGWLAAALAVHAALSVGFGVFYGWLLPRLRPIPGPVAWGGLLIPLLWTAVGYGLMGVVNPLLQHRVYWPGFIVSQFVFGVTAALVVVNSEKIHVPPAGRGPDRVSEFVTGSEEGSS